MQHFQSLTLLEAQRLCWYGHYGTAYALNYVVFGSKRHRSFDAGNPWAVLLSYVPFEWTKCWVCHCQGPFERRPKLAVASSSPLEGKHPQITGTCLPSHVLLRKKNNKSMTFLCFCLRKRFWLVHVVPVIVFAVLFPRLKGLKWVFCESKDDDVQRVSHCYSCRTPLRVCK